MYVNQGGHYFYYTFLMQVTKSFATEMVFMAGVGASTSARGPAVTERWQLGASVPAPHLVTNPAKTKQFSPKETSQDFSSHGSGNGGRSQSDLKKHPKVSHSFRLDSFPRSILPAA